MQHLPACLSETKATELQQSGDAHKTKLKYLHESSKGMFLNLICENVALILQEDQLGCLNSHVYLVLTVLHTKNKDFATKKLVFLAAKMFLSEHLIYNHIKFSDNCSF